ncbi:hypothetical protein ABIC65_002914 [Sphingomonas trueperi]|uniref:hypothetical protein n=1 Tax=Sphingomonas trueperi TaxID=53317 RepID=UPI0033968E4B
MTKPAKTQFRTKCIYCGVNVYSQEHIYGQRFRPHLLETEDTWTHRAVRYGQDNEIIVVRDKVCNGSIYGRSINGPCEKCNNTWMQIINDQAADRLLELKDGVWPNLSGLDREALARWATLFGMTYVHGDALRECVTAEERHQFYQRKLPPHGWSVWVGRLDADARWVTGSGHLKAMTLRPDLGPTSPDTMTLTFSFGRLLFMVFKTLPIYALNPKIAREILGLIRIWPTPLELTHPPYPHITDSGAERVAFCLAEVNDMPLIIYA